MTPLHKHTEFKETINVAKKNWKTWQRTKTKLILFTVKKLTENSCVSDVFATLFGLENDSAANFNFFHLEAMLLVMIATDTCPSQWKICTTSDPSVKTDRQHIHLSYATSKTNPDLMFAMQK